MPRGVRTALGGETGSARCPSPDGAGFDSPTTTPGWPGDRCRERRPGTQTDAGKDARGGKEIGAAPERDGGLAW